MAQTKIDIVNLALHELGFTPIESFDESDYAETANGLYDLVRDSMLLGNPWSWLTARIRLEQTAKASPPGEPPTADGDPAESAQRATRRGSYREEYRIPLTAVVQAIYAGETQSAPDTFAWERRGEFIYTNHLAVWADVRQLSAEPTFHRLFVNALELAVAARLAIPLTEDAEISADLERKARLALREAKRVDAQSQPVKRITAFPYVRARLGGDRVRYGIGSYPQ